MIINQWVPAAHRGDAIGDSARRVRTMLRQQGHGSDIFAMTVDEDLRGDVLPFADAAARNGDVTVFHFALPSPMTEAFATLPGRRVLQYHNITPAHFFAAYDPQLFRLAALGRRELAALVGRVDLALGDSEFNRRELEALGFGPTGVLPIAVDTDRITKAPRRPALERILSDGLINILFVGRIAPNKRIEDHIRLAEVYKRYVDSYYRFIFVGRYDGVPSYYSQVRALVHEYQMLPERFWFTGPVPTRILARSIDGRTHMCR
jgi:glycosyltransferase involved in cell wall biosynthesis